LHLLQQQLLVCLEDLMPLVLAPDTLYYLHSRITKNLKNFTAYAFLLEPKVSRSREILSVHHLCRIIKCQALLQSSMGLDEASTISFYTLPCKTRVKL
ncbi:hypothetical protein, partial [Haemophilus parahaemolyticus]|uniref:hypothetical protein n=1 Tax=Haemophilus parahaemolyticus TaxID=735 RepID=UPI0024913200